MKRHIVSAEANIGAGNVKRSGRSQNDMPPEAASAIEQAKKAQKTVVSE
jgi:hypothetical protein